MWGLGPFGQRFVFILSSSLPHTTLFFLSKSVSFEAIGVLLCQFGGGGGGEGGGWGQSLDSMLACWPQLALGSVL